MTSRHPAVSCACPKCQSERRTTPPPSPPPTPAADANPFVGTNWQVRSDTPATEEREAYALVAYYARRGADDLGAGEVERLLEAAQLLAAEILAAEANERARIVAWLDEQYCLNDDCRLDMIAAIKRNEHGAGK